MPEPVLSGLKIEFYGAEFEKNSVCGYIIKIF